MTGPTPLGITLGFALQFIQQIQEHQAAYLVTYNESEKHRLREMIAELRENIQEFQANEDEFMWEAEFPEVFLEGGFDIVIGNPPYVRQELIRPIKPILERLFPDVYIGTADLYVYFYKRGTELLRLNGILTYISSNKFLRAGYGKKLRKFFVDNVQMHRLLDFGSVQVFRASVDTCIVLVENVSPGNELFFAAIFLDEADIPRLSTAFRERAFPMYARDLSSEGWVLASAEVLALLEKLQNIGTPLGEYVDGFYRGIITGCNDAFIIDEAKREELIAQDPMSAEIIKPLLRGRNLHKWKTNSANEYLIVIASSTNREWPWSRTRNVSEAEQIFAETYPAIYNHLNSYQDRLVARDDQGMFYWELRSCLYYSEFEKPKIIYRRIAQSLDAIYDTIGTFGLDTTYFIPTDDLSLLAILNSKLFDWYARHRFSGLNNPWAGGGLCFFSLYMERVPIADRTDVQRAALSELVEQILADPESDCVREIEQQIDTVVYHLYRLTDQEIALIQQTYRDAGIAI